VVMSVALVSCGSGERDTAATTIPAEPALGAQISSAMQGAQLDVWGGGTPSPGGSTSMFFHRGHHAAEVYWTTNGWCVARLFTWSVERASSATRFDVRYVTDRTFDDCVAAGGDELVLEVYDEARAKGGWTLFGSYPDAHHTWTTRTACPTTGAAPCGFPGAAAAAAPWI
jgi:hypothetical protein